MVVFLNVITSCILLVGGGGRRAALLGRAGMQALWRCMSPVALPVLLLPSEHAHINNYGVVGVREGARPASHNRHEQHLA